MSDGAPLTPAQLLEMTALLEEKLRELERSLSGASEDAQPVSLDAPIGRLTRMDAMQQQHMASARKSRLKTELLQVGAALGRVRGGEYGDCRRCEEPIGFARLKARPEAVFCLVCQEASGR